MRPQPIRIVLGLLIGLELALLALPQPGYAYSNAPRGGDWSVGGPHRTINELALAKFIADNKTDPVLAKYEFANQTLKVNGPRIGAPGTLYRGNLTGIEDKPETFQWWVIEGGYSADEPELYASFRHFYDPRAQELGRPAYLTDHLDQVNSFFLVNGAGLIDIVNPEVDARDWAINGSASHGLGANEYSWKQGVGYMQKAFASTDGVEKSKLFAQAWRSLGETMHLLADMTTPAHVRNDSHPAVNAMLRGKADSLLGILKGDPYETYVQAGMIGRLGQTAISTETKNYLAQDPAGGNDTPEKLFQRVALFTNAEFFSGETVAGTDKQGGWTIHSANHMPDYPSPLLEQTEYKNGQYVKTIGDRQVCLAHESWLTFVGWGSALPMVTAACAESQAAVLVPLAIAGDSKLVDWFMPRVKVEITSVNLESRLVQGTVTHMPQGAYTTAMKFSTPPKAYNPFRLVGTTLSPDDYQVIVQNGALRVTYGDDTARYIENARKSGNAVVNVQIDIGGIYVQSNDYKLSNVPTPTPTRPGVTATPPQGTGGGGAWVLKQVQPNAGKLEVKFSFTGLECNGGTKATSGETNATLVTNGTCVIRNARIASSSTTHTWPRPPDRLIPGQDWSGTLTANESGICYWSDVATEEACRKTTSTNHLVWIGDGWPGGQGGQKEFEYDHMYFATTGRDKNEANAFYIPTTSFKWTVPKGSAANTTLALQFHAHTDGGDVYTNFWYAWDATVGK